VQADCEKCKGVGTIFNDGKGPIVLAWFAMSCPDCNGTGKDQIGTRLMNEYDMLNYKMNNDKLSHEDKMELWRLEQVIRKQILRLLNGRTE